MKKIHYHKKKSFYIRKFNTESTFFKILTGISIPLSITLGLAIAGWMITASIEKSKLDAEYVKIALSILIGTKESQEEKKDENIVGLNTERFVLRNWAVRLLNEKSPVKFSDDERDALRKQGLSFIVREIAEGQLPSRLFVNGTIIAIPSLAGIIRRSDTSNSTYDNFTISF